MYSQMAYCLTGHLPVKLFPQPGTDPLCQGIGLRKLCSCIFIHIQAYGFPVPDPGHQIAQMGHKPLKHKGMGIQLDSQRLFHHQCYHPHHGNHLKGFFQLLIHPPGPDMKGNISHLILTQHTARFSGYHSLTFLGYPVFLRIEDTDVSVKWIF